MKILNIIAIDRLIINQIKLKNTAGLKFVSQYLTDGIFFFFEYHRIMRIVIGKRNKELSMPKPKFSRAV